MPKGWKAANRKEIWDALLRLLREQRQLTYTEIKRELGISDPTLTEYIKYYEGMEWIEHFEMRGDRIHRYYRIKPGNADKIDAQLERYESVKFIESIPNPVHVYDKKGNQAIAVFATTKSGLTKNTIKKTISRTRGAWHIFGKLARGQKIAVVLMIEGEESAKP